MLYSFMKIIEYKSALYSSPTIFQTQIYALNVLINYEKLHKCFIDLPKKLN